MGMGTEWRETLSCLDRISADQRGAGTVTTGWHIVYGYGSITALVNVGEIASGGTFDCKIEQATDASGTGAKALLNATQLGDTDDDSDIIMTARYAGLDLGGGFGYVRLSCTVAGANVDYSAGFFRYWTQAPAMAELDAAAVVENI